MKRDHVEFDVILQWRDEAQAFDLTLIYDHPNDAEDAPVLVDDHVRLDTATLAERAADQPSQYGAALSEMLYHNGQVRSSFERALNAARDYPVHIRLLIDDKAPPEYQAIRWETLRDPGGTFAITTRSNIYFARFFNSASYRTIAPLAIEGQLTALVAVANPSDLADYSDLGEPPLAVVDVAAELERARAALPNIAIRTLPDEQDPTARASLDNVIDRLEEREHRPGANVLYLVCHGRIVDGEPRLLLEAADGTADEVSGIEFARRVAGLATPPTIAAVCSCQSAGAGDACLSSQSEPLAPFGPLLARAGVAIVLAMQGNVTAPTAEAFFKRFFEDLGDHGLADRAATEARRVVDRHDDWWMPVLFSRMRRGRPWYEPRFGPQRKSKLDDLWKMIAENDFTPVLGSGIAGELFLPHRSDLAKNWVQRRQMPIVPATHNDLAKVAQYLSVDCGPSMPHTELRSFLRAHLRTNFAATMPELNWDDPLTDLIRAVGASERERLGDADPYAILASIDLPIYVTTSWTELLEDALIAAGREPVVRSFEWLREVRFGEDPLPVPTPQQPLVYHVFGSIAKPSSIVLTEDDYLVWLRAWMRRVDSDKTDSIPGPVRDALIDTSLVFLGYVLDDWEFRTIFQSVKSFAGNSLQARHQHVGVQLRPETATIDPEAALDYLERYLGEDHVGIYWGSSSEFLNDLDVARPRKP
jgi:hypothetical protein